MKNDKTSSLTSYSKHRPVMTVCERASFFQLRVFESGIFGVKMVYKRVLGEEPPLIELCRVLSSPPRVARQLLHTSKAPLQSSLYFPQQCVPEKHIT